MSRGYAEIKETPYNNYIPAIEAVPSHGEIVFSKAMDMWRNRPSVSDLYIATSWGLPIALAIAATGVTVADTELDLRLGQDMAAVKVMPHSNIAYQMIEEVVQKIGQEAEQYEK